MNWNKISLIQIMFMKFLKMITKKDFFCEYQKLFPKILKKITSSENVRLLKKDLEFAKMFIHFKNCSRNKKKCL